MTQNWLEKTIQKEFAKEGYELRRKIYKLVVGIIKRCKERCKQKNQNQGKLL